MDQRFHTQFFDFDAQDTAGQRGIAAGIVSDAYRLHYFAPVAARSAALSIVSRALSKAPRPVPAPTSRKKRPDLTGSP